MVKNNTVFTPMGKDILRGISREYIFTLCDELGYQCIEKNIDPFDVHEADEAFVTATPFCILPVTKLNNLDIGNGKMGDITTKLLDTWSKNVGMDIKKQIIEYSKEVGELLGDAPTPLQFKRK